MFSSKKKFDRTSKSTYPGGERRGTKKFKKDLFRAVAAFTLISFLAQQCAFAQATPVAQQTQTPSQPVVQANSSQPQTQNTSVYQNTLTQNASQSSTTSFMTQSSTLQPVTANTATQAQPVSSSWNLTQNDLTGLPAGASIKSLHSSMVSNSREGVEVDYDLRNPGTAPGVIFSYDKESTSLVESADFSKLNHLRFAIDSNSEKILFEMEDAFGNKVSLDLLQTNSYGSERIYDIDLTNLSGYLDLDQIRQIKLTALQNQNNFYNFYNYYNPYNGYGQQQGYLFVRTQPPANAYNGYYPYSPRHGGYAYWGYPYNYYSGYWNSWGYGYYQNYYGNYYYQNYFQNQYMRSYEPNVIQGQNGFGLSGLMPLTTNGQPAWVTTNYGSYVNSTQTPDYTQFQLSSSSQNYWGWNNYWWGGWNNYYYYYQPNPLAARIENSNYQNFDFSKNSRMGLALKGNVTEASLVITDWYGQRKSVTLQGITQNEEKFFMLDLADYTWSLDIKNIRFFEIDVRNNSPWWYSTNTNLDVKFGLVEQDTTAPVVTRLSKGLVNQSNYELVLDIDGEAYTEQIQLKEGANPILRSFADRWGNISVFQDVVYWDSAPLILVTSSALTSKPEYMLTYTVDGVAKTQTTTLVEGLNTLTITEQDAAGNVTNQNFNVTLDSIGPVVAATSVALTNKSDYTLTYTVDGAQKTRPVTLVEGLNTLQITEQDLAGNQTNLNFDVTLDSIAPVVAATSVALTNKLDYTLTYTVDGVQKTKAVTLVEGLNALQIAEQDLAGNQTKLSFDVTLDTIAPVVAVTSAVLTNKPDYTLSYTVDGVQKSQPITLVEGLNTLQITEQDLAGNQTNLSFDVTLDSIAPAVSVTSAGLVNKPDYTLIYTVDGIQKTKPVTLTEGLNTLQIAEQDLAGNQTKLSFDVTLDTIAPVVAVTSAVLTNKPDYTLFYTVDGVQKTQTATLTEGGNTLQITESDPAGNQTNLNFDVTLDSVAPVVAVTSTNLVNKPDYTLAYTVDGVQKSQPMTLVEGLNTLQITEQDLAGNQTNLNFDVTLDSIAPVVAATSVALTNKLDYTLTYTVDGVRKTKPVTLIEGVNTLQITEQDAAANQTNLNFDVTLDSIGPVVAATSVALTNKSDYTLSYTVDGVQKTKPVTLTEGLNTLQIAEQDLAGNETKLSFDVTLDTIAPVVAVISAVLTNKPDYTLSYTVDGVQKTQTATLTEGGNTLQISEQDAAGNQTKLNFNVTLDSVAPAITVTSTNLVNKPDYTLSYTVDGVQKTKPVTLVEGLNTLQIAEQDLVGNQTNLNFDVTLDTVGPVVAATSASLTNKPDYTVTYTVDGVQKTKPVTLVEGLNTLQITEQDPAGNETKLNFDVTLDTIAPQVVVTSAVSVNQPDYSLVYTVDGVQKTKSVTLTEGVNTLSIAEQDPAGNETKLDFNVMLETKLPEVVFNSPTLTNNPSYTLAYTSDGTPMTKSVTLTSGGNLLQVDVPTSGGGHVAAYYLVILNALAQPALPERKTNITFNLNGTEAGLIDPSLDASGVLQGGWIETASKVLYRLEAGKIVEELRPEGTRIFYNSDGRAQAEVLANGSVVYYTYAFGVSGNLLRTHIFEGDNRVTLNAQGEIEDFRKSDGTEFFFTQSKLSKIAYQGTDFLYQITQTPDGYEARISGGVTLDPASPLPQIVQYTTSNTIKKWTRGDGTQFFFDESGLINRVLDASGNETQYALANDPLGFLQGLIVSRDGLKRTYGSDGKLKELVDHDGTVFGISNDQVIQITKPDGTVIKNFTHDANGNLKDALIITPDVKELTFVNQALTQVKYADGTLLKVSQDKPFWLTMTDGRQYRIAEELDANNNPVSVAHLAEFTSASGSRSIVQNDKVVQIESTENGVLTQMDMSYDALGRLIQTSVTRAGNLLGTFKYAYSGNETQITNDLNVVRFYDASGKLTQLTTLAGAEYGYSTVTDSSGKTNIVQSLLRVIDQVNGTIDYVDGHPVQITRLDNIEVKNITLDTNGNVLTADVLYPTGASGQIENGKLIRITEADGTVKTYSGGLLQKITSPALVQTNFSYEYDASKNLTLIDVSDSQGIRKYSSLGVLRFASMPNGSQFEYDVQGNLTRIVTATSQELTYSAGTLTQVKNLMTGELLTNIVLDGSGGISAGIFHDRNGQTFTISGGKVTKLVQASGTNLNYNSSGALTQVNTTAGDQLSYYYGSLSTVTRSGGRRLENITQNTSDVITDGLLSLNDGFRGWIYSDRFQSPPTGFRPVISGSLKNPGTALSTAVNPGPTSFGTMTQTDIDKGYYHYPAGSTFEGMIGYTAIPSNAGYVKATIKQDYNSYSPQKIRFEVINGGFLQTVTYSKQYTLYVPSYDQDVYFEIPSGIAANSQFRITFERQPYSASGMYIQNPQFVTRADYAPTDWTQIGVPYAAQKIAPVIPVEAKNLVSGKSTLEANSSQFVQAKTFSLNQVNGSEFQLSSIQDSVTSARLSDKTVIQATFDSSMNLLSTVHANPSFDPASDPAGTWRMPVSGWEENGFVYDLSITQPPQGTPLEIRYAQDGNIQQTHQQAGATTQYADGKIQNVITEDGKTLTYQYASDPNHSGVQNIIINPTANDPAKTEIHYQYDRIREMLRDGVVVYRYSYEYLPANASVAGDASGNEIVVIEDVNAKEERRFSGDRLLSVKGLSTGFITSYTYDASGKISEAVTSRAGRDFGRYAYSYQGTDTTITEESGTRRRYNQAGELQELVTNTGQVYRYTKFSDGLGEDLMLQELAQVVSSLQGTADYTNGKVTKIVTPSGIEVTGIVLTETGEIKSANIHYPQPDNRIAIISNGAVVHISAANGTIQDFAGGFLERVVDQTGNLTTITYTKDVDGNIASIQVEDTSSVRTYTKDGKLTQSVLPDTTRIQYDINGNILSIDTPQSDRLEYQGGALRTIILAQNEGRIDSAVVGANGSLISGVHTKVGVVTTIQNGVVTGVQDAAGNKFTYLPSGKIQKIEEKVGTNAFNIYEYDTAGKLTAITRSNGERLTNITSDTSDKVENGAFISNVGFTGVIPNDIFSVPQGMKPLVNGVIKNPGSVLAANIFPGITSNGTSFTGNTSQELYTFNGVSGYQGITGQASFTPNLPDAGYLKLNIESIQTATPPTTLRLELLDASYQVRYTKDFPITAGLFSPKDIYLEFPSTGGPFQSYRVTFPVAANQNTGLYLRTPTFFARADYAPDWLASASAFLNQKQAPSVPNILTVSASRVPANEAKARGELTLPGPLQVNSGDAARIYGEVKTLVSERVLTGDVVIASAYRESDGELTMTARADNTVAQYVNGEIDKVSDLDGNLLIDYEYDANGDLVKVNLQDAKQKLIDKNLEAQNEIARQKEATLLQLAQTQGQATAQIESQLQSAINSINQQRQYLYDHQRQITFRKILFFKIPVYGKIDISPQLRQLDEMERQARDAASEQLALLDAEVALQKQKIEDDAVTALGELEKQRQTTYAEIIKQELRPVVLHYYRKVLGRDPDQAEISSQLSAVSIQLERIDVQALQNSLSASQEFQTRSASVASIKQAVRDFLNQLSAVSSQPLARDQLLASLGLTSADVITQSPAEIDTILTWLDSRDLHFGHSAFYALRQLLEEGGKQVDFNQLARDSILIDILIGVIHPLTKGDLEISLFALKKVAANYGLTLNPAKITFDELKRELSLGTKGILVHVNGNHYVVVTGITARQKLDTNGNPVVDANGNPVLEEVVVYQEKNAGPLGEAVTVTKEDFMKIWSVTSDQEGVVLTPYVPEASAKMISVEEQKQITGAFFALILGVVALVAQVLITVITLAVATITAIVTVMSAIVSTVITAIANAVVAIGQGLIAFGKLAFAGVKFVAETLLKGLTSGFQFLKQGIMNFGKFLKFAGGPKFIAGALSPEHLIGRQVIGAALSIGTGKTLDKIGVDPTITRLTTAFITGGVIAPTAIGSLGPASAILGGSLRSLIVAGVNELALKIGLAPPIASGLSSISGILTGNILSGNPFSDVIPQLTGEIFSTGVQTLGQFYGIDPRLSALLGIPIGAVAGGVAGGLLQSGGPAGILNSVTQSLFSGATAGGLVGVGSAIALDKVGAPPIAREFVSSFLGQLTASLIQNASSNSGNQNTNSDLNEAGKSILSKVGDGIRKFGQGFAGAVGTVVNFGSRVVQGVGQFTANGFKQVLGSVATLFGQPTQQKIYEDQQGLSQGQVSVSGDVWRYKNGDSQIEYNAVSGEMTESSSVGGTARITGLGMDDAGSIYYQKLTYDSVVSGGAALSQTYDQGKITRISYGIEGTSVLTIQGPAKSNPNQEWIKADGTIVEGEIIIDAHPVMPGITNQGPSFNFLENFFLKLNIFGEKIAEASVGLQSGPSGVGSTSPLAKELFVLVNGIGNLTGASGPEYLRRLKYDVAAQSDPNNKVDAEKDVIPAPVFQVKGLMFKALSTLLGNQQKAQDAAKKLEDAMKVLTTQLAGGSGELSWEAQLGMQQFFNDKGVGNRLRPVVGVGYSGGFVPMVSAIVNEGLTPEAYVALGGATFGVGELLASVIVDVIKAMENVATERNDTTRKLLENAFNLLGATLKGVPGAVANATAFFLSKLDAFYNTIDKTTLDAKVNEFYNDLKQQVGNQTGFNWTTLANSGAKLVVNVWGDKDQLALGNAISGYLPEIGGYTPGDRNQPLFNIEIVGADHFDYIRGVRSADDYVTEYPDMTKRQEAIHRNEIVSGFVAQMISRAKDAQELRDFLTSFGPIVQQVGTDHYRVDLGV